MFVIEVSVLWTLCPASGDLPKGEYTPAPAALWPHFCRTGDRGMILIEGAAIIGCERPAIFWIGASP